MSSWVSAKFPRRMLGHRRHDELLRQPLRRVTMTCPMPAPVRHLEPSQPPFLGPFKRSTPS